MAALKYLNTLLIVVVATVAIFTSTWYWDSWQKEAP